jgi:hypothetical protein
MKHILLSLFLVLGISTQAQTRLSEMPWPQRDSIITARIMSYFSNSHIDKNGVTLISQSDYDYYSVEWIYKFYHKNEKDSMLRAFAPSDKYIYDIDVIGKEYYPFVFDDSEPEIGCPATAVMEEDFNVLLSEATYDVTIIGNGFDPKDKVSMKEVFSNAKRHPQIYEVPTDKELKSGKYSYGKSIASLNKDERIRILTAIALNHIVYHGKKGQRKIDKNDVGVIFPTIGESTFKYLKYDWIPEKYASFKKNELPKGVKPDDIYHFITIYSKDWQKLGLKSPVFASLSIDDRSRKVIRYTLAESKEK